MSASVQLGAISPLHVTSIQEITFLAAFPSSPQENKCTGKVIIVSSRFPLVIHRATQGEIGCYILVIGLLFNGCLASPESELYNITQHSQGPVSWLHSDIAILISWDFVLTCIHHIEYSPFLLSF